MGGKDVDDIDRLVQRFDPAQPDFELYAELRQACPVADLGGAWLLTRYDDVVAAARDDDAFASGPAFGYPGGMPEDEVAGGPTRTPMTIPIMLDPPVFWTYRRLLNPLFTPAKAREREPDIRQITTTLIDAFIERGDVDFHRELAMPLPAILTCRLLGVPEEEWQFFATPVHKMLHDREETAAGTPEPDPEVLALEWDLLFPTVQAMIEIAHQRRSDPRDDLLTALVHAEIDGRPLNDYEIGGIAILVVIGGVDTTTGVIGSALVHLGRHPEVRQRLIEYPSLIPSAVEEFLRVYSPVQMLPRICMSDAELGGQTIGAGSPLLLSWGAANRDPEVFPDPDEVVIDRAPNRHIAFGTGIHRCLGSNLARIEFQVALEETLRRTPDYVLREEGVLLQPNAQIYGYHRIEATFTPGAP